MVGTSSGSDREKPPADRASIMTDSHDRVGAAPGWPAGSDQTSRETTRPAKAGVVRARGLLLTQEGDEYRIVLIDDRARASVALGPYAEPDFLGAWRALAIASGLPCFVLGPDSALVAVDPPSSGPSTRPAYDRNRLVVLSGRRPRFLVRRKASRLPVRPLVFREPELAAGSR